MRPAIAEWRARATSADRRSALLDVVLMRLAAAGVRAAALIIAFAIVALASRPRESLPHAAIFIAVGGMLLVPILQHRTQGTEATARRLLGLSPGRSRRSHVVRTFGRTFWGLVYLVLPVSWWGAFLAGTAVDLLTVVPAYRVLVAVHAASRGTPTGS